MAFTFPLILTSYELLINRKSEKWKTTFKAIAKTNWPFYVITGLSIIPKLSAFAELQSGHPYAFDLSLNSFAETVRFYVGTVIYEPYLSAKIIWVIVILILISPFVFRSKMLAFSLLFTFFAMIPVLPLATHRAGYYLYIPFIGISIYVAEILLIIKSRTKKSRPILRRYLYILVLACCVLIALVNFRKKVFAEEYYLDLSNKHREFIQLLQPLKPDPGTVFLFESAPPGFDQRGLSSVINLLFHAWDMKANIVENCSSSSINSVETDVLCVSFKNKRIARLP